MIGYSEEQAAIRRMVRDFGRREIAPGAEERDDAPPRGRVHGGSLESDVSPLGLDLPK